MLQALCGLAVACTVASQPAQVVASTTAFQSPPRVVEVQEQTPVEPRRRAAGPNATGYADQDNSCEQYNCVGPRTAFRLPDEVPYADYEQQYRNRPAPGR